MSEPGGLASATLYLRSEALRLVKGLVTRLHSHTTLVKPLMPMVDRNNYSESGKANKQPCNYVTEDGLKEERSTGGRKRTRQSADSWPEDPQHSAAPPTDEKRGCAEGMSWWTCLLLGVDQSMTKQQVITKKS